MTNLDQRFLLWNSESVAATPFCCMRCPTFFFSFLHHEHQHHLCQCCDHYCHNLFNPWLPSFFMITDRGNTYHHCYREGVSPNLLPPPSPIDPHLTVLNHPHLPLAHIDLFYLFFDHLFDGGIGGYLH